jgi:hypothetical protein
VHFINKVVIAATFYFGNLPLRKQFAVALAETSVDDPSALLAFAVDVSASVERVLEQQPFWPTRGPCSSAIS